MSAPVSASGSCLTGGVVHVEWIRLVWIVDVSRVEGSVGPVLCVAETLSESFCDHALPGPVAVVGVVGVARVVVDGVLV